MSGYFDDEEPEPEETGHHSELTLGARALVGIVICFVLICGVCFGIGYTMGERGASRAAAAATPPAQTAAPDQEPLQASDANPKPSASEQTPAPAPPASDESTPPTTSSEGEKPETTQPNHEPPKQPAPPAPTRLVAPPPVRQAAPAYTPPPAPRTYTPPPSPSVPSASIAPGVLMVQIAAVANPEDANVLMTALRKRGYAATARRDPDGLIHVRIGPFSSHDEAVRWRDKLLGDGYNAVIQP